MRLRQGSAKDKILKLLLANVGKDLPREEIRRAAGISEWARRVRELQEAGWQIETTAKGYRLQSRKQKAAQAVRSRVSAKQRYRILHRDNSRCRRCGRGVDDGVKLVVDHMIPVDWNGPTVDDNLWTLCEECNLGKKAWESDVDAHTMKQIMALSNARDRLREYFKLKRGQLCTREELQIVAGIAQYARRIRELRDEGMELIASGRGNYTFKG